MSIGTFKATVGGNFVEHRLDSGQQFTGVKFPQGVGDNDIYGATAGITPVQEGFIYPKPLDALGAPADGMGLFELLEFFGSDARALSAVYAHIRVAAGVSWSLYLTDGLGDGDPDTTVDDPTYDALLASGTGTSIIYVMRPITPTSYIRFKTDAAVGVDDAYCRIWFAGILYGAWGSLAP